MKRFLDLHVPITRCNLQCHYCYVPQLELRDTKETEFEYSPQHIGQALSAERMGGICHFNMCGLGETLIPEEVVPITEEILKQGHYIMIVTNGTIRKRFEQFAEFSPELKKRLGFKFSFHYLELKEKNMLDKFFENIDFVRKSGMSFSLELTPSDELEPFIEEVKKICMEKVGAYCHLTIPRDMTCEDIVLLSKHSFEEFCEIWKVFDSDMFSFKRKLWGQPRNEFCYAGEWSGLLNLGNGLMSQCYCTYGVQNLFKDIKKKIIFRPIGNKCSMPHCYNSHSLLGLGCIPEIEGNYALERDRIDKRNQSHWLNEDMRNFLSERLEDDNKIHGRAVKAYFNFMNSIILFLSKVKHRFLK